MNTIPEIKNMPDGSIVNAVQGKIVRVFPRKENVGKFNKTVQNAELSDLANNKIRLTVWEHPELSPLKDTELILHSSNNGKGTLGGVSVKHDSYIVTKDGPQKGETIKTIELSVGKSGRFQHVEVYHQINQTPPSEIPAKAIARVNMVPDAPKFAKAYGTPGVTVGMAINNAVKIIVDLVGYDSVSFESKLEDISRKIISVASRLERGDPEQTPVSTSPAPLIETKITEFKKPSSSKPAFSDEDDGDVPF